MTIRIADRGLRRGREVCKDYGIGLLTFYRHLREWGYLTCRNELTVKGKRIGIVSLSTAYGISPYFSARAVMMLFVDTNIGYRGKDI